MDLSFININFNHRDSCFESNDTPCSSLVVESSNNRIKWLAKSFIQERFLYALLTDKKIEVLNDNDFFLWMKRVAHFIESGLEDPITQVSTLGSLLDLLSNRSLSEKEAIPIFYRCGHIENGEIESFPKYRWISPQSEPCFRGLSIKHIKSELSAAFSRASLFNKVIRSQVIFSRATKENIDAAFIYLKNKKDLVWEHKNEFCYARATAASEYLRALGFFEGCLFNALIVGNSMTLETESHILTWRFHIAVGVELENGSQYILDPSTNSEHPIDIRSWEWLNRSPSVPINRRPLVVLDRRVNPITSKELDKLEKKKSNSVVLLPFNYTCYNPGLGQSLYVSRSTAVTDIHSHLDNQVACERISSRNWSLPMLEEHFFQTPRLLSIFTGSLPFPELI